MWQALLRYRIPIALVAILALSVPALVASLAHNIGALAVLDVIERAEPLAQGDGLDLHLQLRSAETLMRYATRLDGSAARSVAVSRLLATAYLAQEQFGVASWWAGRGLVDNPTDPIVALRLGQTLMQTGRRDDAIKVWRTARAATYFVHEANKHHWAGDDAAALESYRTAVAIDPTAVATDLRVAMAWVYYQLGEKVPAETELVAAVAHAAASESLTRKAFALGSLGIFLGRENRWLEATEKLRQALMLTPDDHSLVIWLGAGYNHLGLYEAAEAELLKVLENRGANEEVRGYAYVNLAETYRQIGDWEAVLAAHRMAVKLHPENAEYHWYLAKALMDAGHLADAQNACEVTLKLDPQPAVRSACEQILTQPLDR